MLKLVPILAFIAATGLWAQEAPAPPPAPAGAPAPASVPSPYPETSGVADDAARVAVLGYHDFSETLPETAMRIRTSKFRKQMETIRQLGITPLTLDDFIAWKSGTKSIPEKAVLLTLDDGWKSVYTDAFPILREFGYPYTLYLYKNYVDGGGKALTSAMIEEMMTSGASIGSHSTSHPFPSEVKGFQKKGSDPYDAFLRKELGESKRFLESKFSRKVTTYAYPGGFHTGEMLKLAHEFGYTHLFTVLPGKVKRSLPNATLPRYMILGNHDSSFDAAVSFKEAPGPLRAADSSLPAPAAQPTPYPVSPESGAIISSRLPEISADLSKLENFDPASLAMTVSGFGAVPAVFAPETKKFSWRVNRRLRQPACRVSITWKDAAGVLTASPLTWSFQIDREAAYLPAGD